MSDADGEGTQVLEFDLGPETYCVDIGYVAEIVDTDKLTRIPNAPSHVRGVMDLRGRTTSIIDPKIVFDADSTGAEKRIIVFDPAATDTQGAIGWVVDEVDQVVTVDPGTVDDSPLEDDAIEGIVKREDGFVIWISPQSVAV
ncbi:chemotaxis protein CheW [Halalkalicoccus jeotgali]|uniref:Chemotaxis protein CheW n=1 Tax=Halalkalicoccus jeotgali (strain DSM 18796 / CECT 7217 / JCM 14584 / KCTC 4019 / B3) TaxID=795797 RepID=D8J2Q8_HALJB|nr:chemotaxis protein CheW [Halalkalicoccus jeotgali]ADJ15015.1 chemotaxis protein CheW [Halalkalicoccus jeotgali B3]ELY34969.1 chemotaxis protein CheW [Halalkalicoccus jeotgali B3]